MNHPAAPHNSAAPPPLPPLRGLVLLGGRSTRMGEDKSALCYHGRPQREHVAELLRPFCQSVYWSVNARQATELAGGPVPLIADVVADRGPLGGLLSAFHYVPDVAWLLVACDMPRLTATTLLALVAGRNPGRLATAFRNDAGEPEPLLSIWEPSAAASLRQATAAGRWSPRRFLAEHATELLTPPDPRELLNVNDPVARQQLRW